MRRSWKLVLALIICFILFNLLYFREFSVYLRSNSVISPAFATQNYKYWSKENGENLCDEPNSLNKNLEKYVDKKTSIIYIQNIDIFSCPDKLPKISKILHDRDLLFAINLVNKFDYKKYFSSDLKNFQSEIYEKELKDYPKYIHGWVDYIVIDNAMEFLNYTDRHELFLVLRKIFPSASIGFRFTRHYDINPTETHPIRHNQKIENFLPRSDDGDFIITSFPVQNIRRTQVFVEDMKMDKINVNGEFIE